MGLDVKREKNHQEWMKIESTSSPLPGRDMVHFFSKYIQD
jgi:hypothetical protein